MSLDERADASVRLTARLLELPEIAQAPVVLAFASAWAEVSTEPLLRRVLDSGRTLLLPYVAEDGRMQAAAVTSLDALEPGFRGIPEPRDQTPVSIEQATAIVVPGVAFDPRGGRLGYGGGFYDRFLAAAPARAVRIGICFDAQVVDEVPVEDHDQRVQVVVTEARTIRA